LTKFVVLDHFSFIFLFVKGSAIPQHIIAYSHPSAYNCLFDIWRTFCGFRGRFFWRKNFFWWV